MTSCRLYKLLVVSARSLQRPPAGNKTMGDSILMAIIVACTLPNVIICAIWIFVDPIIVTSYTYLDTRTYVEVLQCGSQIKQEFARSMH